MAAQTEVIEYSGQDALGSVRIVFNASGVATARADFEPFGELFTVPGMPGGPLPAQQFTGQERDPEASQDYFGARFFMPRMGRFSQVDPVYAGLFDPQQWNRYAWYAYVRNNPLSLVDPDGRQTGCRTTTQVGGFTINCPQIPQSAPWNGQVDSALPRPADFSSLAQLVPEPETLLEIASIFLPIADVIIAGNEVRKGNYSDAAIAGVGFIPLVGDAGKVLIRRGDRLSISAARSMFRRGYWAAHEFVSGMHVHHVLPVNFAAEFWARWNIDIWDFEKFAAQWAGSSS